MALGDTTETAETPERTAEEIAAQRRHWRDLMRDESFGDTVAQLDIPFDAVSPGLSFRLFAEKLVTMFAGVFASRHDLYEHASTLGHWERRYGFENTHAEPPGEPSTVERAAAEARREFAEQAPGTERAETEGPDVAPEITPGTRT